MYGGSDESDAEQNWEPMDEGSDESDAEFERQMAADWEPTSSGDGSGAGIGGKSPALSGTYEVLNRATPAPLVIL